MIFANYGAWLSGVLVEVMATAGAFEIPAILLDALDYIAILHEIRLVSI